jgi:hypothetical protein
MKKFTVLCLLLGSLRASGDLVLVEQIVEPRLLPQTITITVKGDKLRKDLPNNISIIDDLATGDSLRINHAAKVFKKISMKDAQEAIAQLHHSASITPAKPPAIVDTGKSEKVDGHDAEIYTASTPAATYVYWVTKDYPDYAVVREEMKKLRELGKTLDKANNLSPDDSQLDGIVIKSQSLSAAGKLTTITLVSAKAKPVDDSEFRIPDGYTEIITRPMEPIPDAPAQ